MRREPARGDRLVPAQPDHGRRDGRRLQRLVDLAREHEFLLIHDFAYADVAFDGHKPPSVLAADGAAECAVELYSLTKSFSMAGWRVGFVLGNVEVVAALAKLKSYLDYGTFQPIQIAVDRRAARGRRVPGRGLRDLRAAARRPLRGPRPRRLARRAAARDDVRLGAASRAVRRAAARSRPPLRLAREAHVAVSPGHRLRRRRRRARPLRARRERTAHPPGDPRDREAAPGV